MKSIIKSRKRNIQKQHVRKYESGKVTLVNKGIKKKRKSIFKKPKIHIVKRPTRQDREKKEEKKQKTKLTARPDKPYLERNFGLKVGEPGCLYSYPLKQGVLLHYIPPLDSITTKRWNFYLKSIIDNKIGDIPKINFSSPHPEATKMLKKCINYSSHKGISGTQAVEKLIEWILWAFGDPIQKNPPDIPEEVNRFWYQTFDFGLLMRYPADYMAYLLQEYGHKGGPGWFATPMPVCIMMNEMTVNKRKKWEKVYDSCAGTGSILLPASNYSVNMYASDISLIMVKALHVNSWLYVPWLIKPFPKHMIENLKKGEKNEK
jgi:hypothetical protein